MLNSLQQLLHNPSNKLLWFSVNISLLPMLKTVVLLHISVESGTISFFNKLNIIALFEI